MLPVPVLWYIEQTVGSQRQGVAAQASGARRRSLGSHSTSGHRAGRRQQTTGSFIQSAASPLPVCAACAFYLRVSHEHLSSAMDALTGSLHISARRILLLCLAAASVSARLGGLHYASVVRTKRDQKRDQNTQSTQDNDKAIEQVLALRGGSTLNFNLGGDPVPVSSSGELDLTGTAPVLVSTSFGSMFLDKKKKLVLGKNETVADLKAQLSSKFPGSPPVALQHLYFGSRRLEDSVLIGNISSLSPLPLALDMMSGTR
jgi:hypothetical protein